MNPARQRAALLALNKVPLRVFAVALAQIGSVASTFGMNREFSTIAAAVLGGNSLLGGPRPGLAAHSFWRGADPSRRKRSPQCQCRSLLYPLVTGGIIFFAILLDSVRSQLLSALGRRRIRPEEATATSP